MLGRTLLVRICVLGAMLLPPPALAAPAKGTDEGPMVGPYIVADLETGEVYGQHDALRPWYPASTTKLMTAYVVFKAIRNGEFTLDSPVTVSAHAASEPASKMGFAPGTILKLRDALRMMLVHSANDIAMAIAETVGGSEAGFALRMDIEAARLGMTRSQFVNPNGLPDPRQLTSVRDMAILTRALLADFPERRDFFTIPAIRFGGRVLKNHNSLINRFPGATGMKTGYICSSGFNIVATARRDGHEIVAIVFGAYDDDERGEFTARLLEKGFAAAERPRGHRVTLANVSSGARFTEAYDLRPLICSGRKKPTIAYGGPPVLGPRFDAGPPVAVSILSVPTPPSELAAATPPLPRSRPRRASDASATAFAPTIEPRDPSAAVIGPMVPRPRPAEGD